mmetsp:Transcript_18339/g.30578  ORF Transcript_18339/g.30578 Transcript_18339/m.30578 type:complete len:142 (+) Transcript_18339:109-534(+)
MKRSSVSFTSHLSELSESDCSSDSSTCSEDSNSRVYRRCKSFSDVRNQSKRHIRRKTSPNSYFEFSPTRDINIGMDLVLLEQLQEQRPRLSKKLSPSKFLPLQNVNHFDSTFGLVSLKILDDETENEKDDIIGDEQSESSK